MNTPFATEMFNVDQDIQPPTRRAMSVMYVLAAFIALATVAPVAVLVS